MSNVLRAINQSLFLVIVFAEGHPILNLWQDLFSVLDFFKPAFPISVFLSVIHFAYLVLSTSATLKAMTVPLHAEML